MLTLQCSRHLGNNGLRLDVSLSHLNGDSIRLTFTGVTDLKLDGFQPLLGFRILDATEFRPEIPAPICVVHYTCTRDGGEQVGDCGDLLGEELPACTEVLDHLFARFNP